MIVCGNCKLEMICVKTGRPMVWGDSHVYSGDEFECKGCGSKVCHAHGQAHHQPNYSRICKDNPTSYYNMDKPTVQN